MCPKPCSCSPSLPPPILPGLWDVPPRPHTTPSSRSVSVSVSCTALGLGSVPSQTMQDNDLPDPHIIVDLDLSANALSELPPNAFVTYPHLQQLKLSRNNLYKIAPDSFVPTPLRVLKLSRNNLYKIAPDSFVPTPLRVLLLDDNSLVSLPYDLHLPPLEELSLQKNFFESIPRPVTRLLTLRAL
ncbi:Leucine-rich repeat [Trinorchestia longiramus]|nr:Leucine-rich repeat [Trinorchestia longiramus]